ncbi:hypothetical protein TNCT_456111 [Trichonephila clavata]|uniref:Uncharacterized protein n=1 Tax=Trichonephila clavata TaxID=2740835 RepID=A0A8X6HQD5_TRICU|nr:hypothetical protein TNCT_456111 [Trichonephila clavata]
MFRRRRGQPQMSWATIVGFYSRLREVAEIIGSHHDKLLGGPSRKTKTMTQVVLGIYCRDDKEGIFFWLMGKKRKIFGLVLLGTAIQRLQ